MATTPWAPDLKLSATELSKNITTLTVDIASNLNANIFQAACFPAFRTPNLRLPMSFLIGIRPPKHYPAHAKRYLCHPGQAVSYSRDGPETAISPFRLTYTVVVTPKNSHTLTPIVPPNSAG